MTSYYMSPLLIKIYIYESAWNPYSLIMDCYRFLGTFLKVHYIMAIQKLSMKLIQCDYITYNVVVSSPFSF
jgi:hypothetical protein